MSKKLNLAAKLGILSGLGLGVYGGTEIARSYADFKDLGPDEIKKIIAGKTNISPAKVNVIAKTMGIKTPVHIARSVKDVKEKLKSVGGYQEDVADIIGSDPEIKDIFENKNNAMYLLQNPDIKKLKAHIVVVPDKASLPVVAHELGHAKDVEDAGGAAEWRDKYRKKIHEYGTSIFSKKPYQRTTRKREEAAWRAIPKEINKKDTEEALLKTYDLSERELSGIKKILLGTLLSGGGLYALKRKGWR